MTQYVIEINGKRSVFARTADEAADQAREAAKSAGRGELVRAIHIPSGKFLYEAQEGRALRLVGGSQ